MSNHGLRGHVRILNTCYAMVGLVIMGIFIGGCSDRNLLEGQETAIVDKAEELMALYDFDEAYELLTPYLPLMKEGTPEWVRMVYLHSVAGWQALPPSHSRIEEARRGFLAVVEKASDSAFAPMALRNLGRMSELRTHPSDVVDVEKARGYYEQILKGWPGTQMAHEAAARLAGTYIRDVLNLDSIRKGEAILEDYLKEYPDNVLAGLMWEYLAETRYNMLKDKEGALLSLVNADKAGWADPTKTLINLWRMATLAEELGQIDLAVSAYRRVIIEHTRGGRTWAARQRLLALKEAYPDYSIELPEMLAIEE